MPKIEDNQTKNEKEEQSIPEGDIKSLNDNDVLCGRGSGPNDHCGNVAFRKLVSTRRREYLSTSTRAQKAVIAKEIVDVVWNLKPPGRFLEKVTETSWNVVSDEKALEKVKQALRQMRHRKAESLDLAFYPVSSVSDQNIHRRITSDPASHEIEGKNRISQMDENPWENYGACSNSFRSVAVNFDPIPYNENLSMDSTVNVPNQCYMAPKEIPQEHFHPTYRNNGVSFNSNQRQYPINHPKNIHSYQKERNGHYYHDYPDREIYSSMRINSQMYEDSYRDMEVDRNPTKVVPAYVQSAEIDRKNFHYVEHNQKSFSEGLNRCKRERQTSTGETRNFFDMTFRSNSYSSYDKTSRVESSCYMSTDSMESFDPSLEPQPYSHQRNEGSLDEIDVQACMNIVHVLDSDDSLPDFS